MKLNIEHDRAKGSRTVPARDIMTKSVRTVSVDTSVREIAQLLGKRRISAVAMVGCRRHVAGIVSLGGLLGALAKRAAGPSTRTISDAAIGAKLPREREQADGIGAAPVNFAVTPRAADFSGLAANDDRRAAIRVVAEAISGVRGVTKRIGIRQSGGYEPTYALTPRIGGEAL